MIPAAVMMRLATLGLNEAQAMAVADMLTVVEAATAAVAEAGAEKGREKARARWRKWKDNQPTNVSKRLPTTANVSKQLVRVEDSSSKEDISKREDKKESAAAPRGVEAFKAELVSILDAERIEAIIAVRRKKGATFSALAGRSLAKALSSWRNANEAADEMVLRNWTGFKPEWMSGGTARPPSTASPPAQDFNSILDAIQGKPNAAHSGPTIDGSHERTDRGGASSVVQFHALSSGR